MPSECVHRVQDMGVARVREALSRIRAAWKDHRPDAPLDPSAPIFDESDMTIQDFAFGFVYAHHLKRHNKKRSKS